MSRKLTVGRIEQLSNLGKARMEVLHVILSKKQRELLIAEGESRILKEVAKLPSPWRWKFMDAVYECAWCQKTIATAFERNKPPHPDNGCLWPRALAALSPLGKE